MENRPRAQDARAIVQAAAQAMGTASLKTVQYAGTGWNAAVGQSFSPSEDWPRALYTDHRLRREILTRRAHAQELRISTCRDRIDRDDVPATLVRPPRSC